MPHASNQLNLFPDELEQGISEARALAAAQPKKWGVCFLDGCEPYRQDGEIYVASHATARAFARSLAAVEARDVCAMPVKPWACKRVYFLQELITGRRVKL